MTITASFTTVFGFWVMSRYIGWNGRRCRERRCVRPLRGVTAAGGDCREVWHSKWVAPWLLALLETRIWKFRFDSGRESIWVRTGGGAALRSRHVVIPLYRSSRQSVRRFLAAKWTFIGLNKLRCKLSRAWSHLKYDLLGSRTRNRVGQSVSVRFGVNWIMKYFFPYRLPLGKAKGPVVTIFFNVIQCPGVVLLSLWTREIAGWNWPCICNECSCWLAWLELQFHGRGLHWGGWLAVAGTARWWFNHIR